MRTVVLESCRRVTVANALQPSEPKNNPTEVRNSIVRPPPRITESCIRSDAQNASKADDKPTRNVIAPPSCSLRVCSHRMSASSAISSDPNSTDSGSCEIYRFVDLRSSRNKAPRTFGNASSKNFRQDARNTMQRTLSTVHPQLQRSRRREEALTTRRSVIKICPGQATFLSPRRINPTFPSLLRTTESRPSISTQPPT